ncbi:MAG TPA: hypothetical protein VK213_13680 [Bacteroidales bacterium]|nr:hypothetical protein [Bacteroidales bacterium]
MKAEENKRNQTGDNVGKYLKGKLSGEERNVFEKQMQKDMFLDEAVEGLSELTAEQYEDDLKKLEKRLRNKTIRSQKVILYRVAASVAVLIVASVFILIERDRTTMPQKEEVNLEIAMNQPVLMPEEADQDKVSVSRDTPGTETRKKEELPPVVSGNASDDNTYSTSQEKPAEQEIIQPSASAAGVNKEAEANAIPERASAPLSATSKSVRSFNTNYDAGRKGSITEEAKRAEIPGYINITLSSHDQILKESSGQEGTKNYSPPEPIAGIEEFKKYIINSILAKNIAKSQDSVIEAGFRVLPDGSLDNIILKTSAGKNLSDEITKVLKEGPTWQAAEKNGVPVEEEVTLKIELK